MRRFPVDPWWWALSLPVGVVGLAFLASQETTVVTLVLFFVCIAFAILPATLGADRWFEKHRPDWPIPRKR